MTPAGSPLSVAETLTGDLPEPGLGDADTAEQPGFVQAGGEQLVPYLKTVEVTVAPFGLTVPARVAPLVVTPVASPATTVGASGVAKD